jgi:hypothetical protein
MNDVLGVEPQNASGLEGKEDPILYFNLPELFFIDVQMHSPPDSPSRNLQGASRITGGILHGRAQGNVFNFADSVSIKDQEGPVMGKVLIYTTHVTPTETSPFMVLKHKVIRHLGPILNRLATRYSIFAGKPYF